MSFSPPPRSAALPLRPDLVPQDQVGDEAQRDEEDAQHDEVQVEFGVLHVQLSQNGLRLLEVAGLVDVAVQVLSVQAVDGQDDPFEPVPAEESAPREDGSAPGPQTPSRRPDSASTCSIALSVVPVGSPPTAPSSLRHLDLPAPPEMTTCGSSAPLFASSASSKLNES